MSKKEVAVIEKAIIPLVAEAQGIVIKDEDGMENATAILSRLNKLNDKIEAEEDKITKPLMKALNAERARWKPAKLQYKKAIDYLRDQMSKYQTKKVKAAKEEELKIASRLGSGKGKLSLDVAARKITEIDRPYKRVETDEGMVSFRTDKILKIVDASLIPRKYLVVDEKATLAALIAGQDVPGATIEEVQVPINKRK